MTVVDAGAPGSAPVAGKSRPVKLACRDVWKVYGTLPARYRGAQGLAGDVEQTAAGLRAAGCITAAAGVSFDVFEGEIFVIMGLSGSGKSTMIRCLSRLVEPTAGEVILDGQDLLRAAPGELVELRRHKMGMVFQDFGLLPHLTVLENVAFPLKVQGMEPAARLARAREMIELVGLEGRDASFPRQLSGGQQQRVGIARSLAVEPELWLLDEPFSALDPLIRRQMQDEFLRLQRMLGKTIVFITHDFAEALKLADRIAIMKDGMVVQCAPPAEIVTRPATAYVAEFTRDVPVSRILTVKDVMEPGPVARSEAIAATPEMTLESLLPRIAAGEREIPVQDETGIIGLVRAEAVARVLAEPVPAAAE